MLETLALLALLGFHWGLCVLSGRGSDQRHGVRGKSNGNEPEAYCKLPVRGGWAGWQRQKSQLK